MSSALRGVSRKNTSQKQKAAPGQKRNNAGGFSFVQSDMGKLERFLIIGTDGGTYYATEKTLTTKNVEWLEKLLKSDPLAVLEKVRDISTKGRAYKQSPAIFALALAMNTVDEATKPAVRAVVADVCRTSTHLFEYAQYLENLGGWGRSKRKSVAEWYSSKTVDELAYQAVKYRQRNGWTHQDLLRLSHVKLDNDYRPVANFILGNLKLDEAALLPKVVKGFQAVQNAKTIKEVVHLVTEYGLPWEAVPTEWHKSPELWRALFEKDQLGQTALLRNVVRLAKLDMFNDMKFAANYAERLADKDRIKKGRLHPINYLNALVVYDSGQVQRPRSGDYSSGWSPYGDTYHRNKTWSSSGVISDALDEGFYGSFGNVVPAKARSLIALDVSGSMSSAACSGLDLSAAQVGAAMSMITARTEPYTMVRGFSTNFVDLGITPKMKISEAMRAVQRNNFGGTDCAMPMKWAASNGVEIDTFLVITDNETYAGRPHPHQALKSYRDSTGIDARMVVAGVASNGFTIADPSDKGMLDVVGFDASGPGIIADFSAGRL